MAFTTTSLDFIGNTYGVGLKSESSQNTSYQAYGGTDSWVNEQRLSFWVRGYNSISNAKSALETYLHITYDDANGVPTLNGLPWAELTIDNTPSPLVYTADVVFRTLSEEEKLTRSGINDEEYVLPAVRQDQLTFSSGGENEHIEKSESTSWTWTKNNATPWTFNGLIDFNNGNIGGYDRMAQSIDFSFSLPLPKTWFNSNNGERLKTYMSLIGTTNNASFYVFDANCVLFQSFNATPTYFTRKSGLNSVQDWYWDTQFNFNVKPSRTLTMPDDTTKNVEGHDYVWNSVTTIQKYENYSDYIVKQINCERIYPQANFALLGLSFEV